MVVIIRSGQDVVFTWDNPTSENTYITEFRLESSDTLTGPKSVEVGGIAPSQRTVTRAVSAHKFFHLAAVKDALATYAPEVVEVVIDNSPLAPSNFTGAKA